MFEKFENYLKEIKNLLIELNDKFDRLQPPAEAVEAVESKVVEPKKPEIVEPKVTEAVEPKKPEIVEPKVIEPKVVEPKAEIVLDRDEIKRELSDMGLSYNERSRTNTLKQKLDEEKAKATKAVEKKLDNSTNLEVLLDSDIEKIDVPDQIKVDDIREIANELITAHKEAVGHFAGHSAGMDDLRNQFSKFNARNPNEIKAADYQKCYMAIAKKIIQLRAAK